MNDYTYVAQTETPASNVYDEKLNWARKLGVELTEKSRRIFEETQDIGKRADRLYRERFQTAARFLMGEFPSDGDVDTLDRFSECYGLHDEETLRVLHGERLIPNVYRSLAGWLGRDSTLILSGRYFPL